MLELDVIENAATAAIALDPIKSRLLAELSAPASAATLAGRVGLSRQKVNYHLRGLEDHQLIEQAEERQWGGLTERLMIATASSYVVSPAALGAIGADPARNNDRLSASYLIALAARIVRVTNEPGFSRPAITSTSGKRSCMISAERAPLTFAAAATA